MRKNPQVVAGWSLISTISDSVCDLEKCSSTVTWRPGITEIQVFGVVGDGNATTVSEKTVFMYK